MKKTRRCSIISIEQSVLGVEDVEVDIPSKYRIVSRIQPEAQHGHGAAFIKAVYDIDQDQCHLRSMSISLLCLCA